MEEIYIAIPCKVIAAEPMHERDFTFLKGEVWDEEKPNRLGYQVRDHNGFTSWHPKDIFEEAYRKLTVDELTMMATVGTIERGELPIELRGFNNQGDTEDESH